MQDSQLEETAAAILNANRPPDASSSSNTQSGAPTHNTIRSSVSDLRSTIASSIASPRQVDRISNQVVNVVIVIYPHPLDSDDNNNNSGGVQFNWQQLQHQAAKRPPVSSLPPEATASNRPAPAAIKGGNDFRFIKLQIANAPIYLLQY